MHELSLAQDVLQIIEEHSKKDGYSRVTSVWLEIGALAGVEPDALRFCFEAVTRNSLARGARLEIVDVPGSGWCLQCGDTVAMQERYSACPRCGGYQLRATGGMGMRVRELEAA
jgi:hydrogenase nickel incorporation protein HypA/HybF